MTRSGRRRATPAASPDSKCCGWSTSPPLPRSPTGWTSARKASSPSTILAAARLRHLDPAPSRGHLRGAGHQRRHAPRRRRYRQPPAGHRSGRHRQRMGRGPLAQRRSGADRAAGGDPCQGGALLQAGHGDRHRIPRAPLSARARAGAVREPDPRHRRAHARAVPHGDARRRPRAGADRRGRAGRRLHPHPDGAPRRGNAFQGQAAHGAEPGRGGRARRGGAGGHPVRRGAGQAAARRDAAVARHRNHGRRGQQADPPQLDHSRLGDGNLHNERRRPAQRAHPRGAGKRELAKDCRSLAPFRSQGHRAAAGRHGPASRCAS